MKIRAHESFYIRKGWLQKGVKNVSNDAKVFANDNVCDILGIGSNMVKALRYWLNATRVIEERQYKNGKNAIVTNVGKLIEKYDKYYEELGTLQVIHYLLSSNEEDATAWYWFFNIYSGTIVDKKMFVDELSHFLKVEYSQSSSQKVLEDEFNCLINTYNSKSMVEDDPEETKICPLSELKLVELVDSKSKEYKKVSAKSEDIHPMIAYAIISKAFETKDSDEMLINDICDSKCNLGKTFNLDRISIISLLNKLVNWGYISISRTAGLDIIRVVRKMSFLECLESYYKMLNGEEK